MDMEISLADRLQILRQWQVEQQEKLLRHQQMQRQILSHKQDCIYKVLGFSKLNLEEIKNIENVCVHEMEIDTKETMSESHQEEITNVNALYKDHKVKEILNSSHISSNTDENKNSTEDYRSGILSQKQALDTNLLIEGIKPLSLSNNVITSNKSISIDDIPLASPKKDFQTLLEETLRKETKVALKTCTNPEIKIKRPFLKKGQGLSRFKMSAKSYLPPANMKKRNTSKSLSKSVSTHIDKNDKNKKFTTYKNMLPKNNVSFMDGMQQLNSKNLPSSQIEKVHNKSTSIIPVKQVPYNGTTTISQLKYPPETNISDIDSKTERELEEVRIFELLEEKVENSSFCSTSSTVLAFLQQSTPFKVKEKVKYVENEDNIVMNMKQQQTKRTSNIVANMENTKSSIQQGLEHLDIPKRSHKCTTAIDSYCGIVTTNDTREKIQKTVNQISESNETHIDHLETHDTSCDRHITVSLSDEEENISMKKRNLTHDDNKDADTNHRVRFSEHNEYRTIDLIDVSHTSIKSSLDDYLEQKDWNDCFVNTSELSDVEEKLPVNSEKYMSSLEVIANEKTVNASMRLSLQHDVMKDSYCHTMKTLSVSEEENASSKNESSGENTCGDDECVSIIEEIVQTSDEEHSVFSSSSSPSSSSSSSSSSICTHQGLNICKSKKYKPRKITDKFVETYSNVEEVKHCLRENTTKQTNTFKPQLLESRLLELEKEINIFRKESSALLNQRRKLQEDQITLHKEYAEKNKHFEENKRRVQNELEEEKRKLAREKIAMENRIRDAQEKMRQNKMERQKMQSLQDQLENLRDELNTRESRWNATESRYKSELRVQRMEISKLKQEIANLQNVKKTNGKNVKKANRQVIKKTVGQINKHVSIATSSKEVPAKTSRNLPDVSVHDDNNDNDENIINIRLIEDPIMKTTDIDDNQIRDNISVNAKNFKFEVEYYDPKLQKSAERNITEKEQNLHGDLLSDITSDIMKNQNPSDIPHMTQDISNFCQPIVRQLQDVTVKNDDKSYFVSTNDAECHTDICHIDSNKNNIKTQDRLSLTEKTVSSFTLHTSSSHPESRNATNTKDALKQIQYPDGHIEYWYPNGNVKKIFPNQGITKIIYYNGDVRETDKDGRIRYFYATTRTWHTTTPDALEILEFPDGQVEKRKPNGTIEVSFPDGVTRIAQADGTEKWTLPDGTVAETFINGDKILTLPNGQREIHTKTHKRREYPDGTVKLIYADGTQETRYANGRKRLKDKDGNLLMDSYDS